MTKNTKNDKKPVLIALAIAFLFAVAAFIGLGKIRDRQSAALTMPQAPLPVKMLITAKGILQQKIPALATVKSAATIQIKAEIAGRIISLPLREGDHFKKGDVLAIIDGREQQAQLSAAKAKSNVVDGQIASLKANIRALESQKKGLRSNFDFLEAELKRYERLFESQAISESAIEAHRNKRNDAESKLLSLDAQIQAQKSQVSTLESQKQASRNEVALWQVRKEYSEIIADFDGVVTLRHQEEGNRVMPGTPVLTIDDISHTRLIMQLPQTAVHQVEMGQKVFSREFPEIEFHVNRIYPALNELRQFVVEAAPNASVEQLKLDMQLPVSLIVKQVEGTIVSNDACFVNFNDPDEIYLYVMASGTAERTSFKPLLKSSEGHAVFAESALAPGTAVARGVYLENVRLPASFPVEVPK